MSRVVIDVMGSDLGVQELVKGVAHLSMEPQNDIYMVLVGDALEISEAFVGIVYHPRFIEIVHAEDFLTQEDSPQKIHTSSGSSISVACELLNQGHADALVSAGNTGGVILGCSKAFQRIEGVKRVGLAAVMPTEKRRGDRKDPFALLMDVGATLHVDADDLRVFALMGSIYSSIVSNNDSPTVALLSNGTESSKGAPEVVEAHQQLLSSSQVNFIGNIEGLDIPRGSADVIVCEGFMGNVVLKLLEGITELAADLAKDAYQSKLVWRLGLTMLSSELKKLRTLTDWKQYGGAPILGFEHVVIKAHGRSNAQAMRNAIRLASKVHRGGLIEQIQNGLTM
jgi:glycerol-3-phosphate acyltransferase PlsX